ncbi:MAG: carbohydrate kinase family protein [Hyphomicrobiaceae bacterium]
MKALTIGGAMVDTIAIVEDDLIERISMSNAGKTFLLLEQGSKTEASSISTHCGGGALNAAVSLSRLGFNTSILAKLGTDPRADLVRQKLVSENISADALLSTDEAPTGASAIISAHDRNAAIFTFRGANTLLRAHDLKPSTFDVDLVYVSTLSGKSADILPEIIRYRPKTARLSVNPGIRQITSRFVDLWKALPDIDILAINRLEAETFVRQAVAELAGNENATLRRIAAAGLAAAERPDCSRSDVARALIAGLRDLGARTILLTDGRHGAYVGLKSETLFCPPVEAPVASTAGAGDAFVSTFSGLFACSGDFEHALQAATINAASVVTAADSQSGLLRQPELEKHVVCQGLQSLIERWHEIN